MVFNGTTYAFTTMLAAILCGIVCGSLAGSLVADRLRRPVSALGVVEMLFGIACLLVLAQFAGLPQRLLDEHVFFDWGKLVRTKFLLSFGILFLPTFFSGMTFPIVVRAATGGQDRLGRDVGRLYGANTLGGILGALAGGYGLLPLLGTHSGAVVLGVLLFAVGGGLVLWCPAATLGRKALLIAAGSAAVSLMIVRLPADVGRTVSAWYVPAGETVIHYDEGVEGTVVVSEPKGGTSSARDFNRQLWINGMQATSSYERGVKMNRFQGVLPLLFVETPRRALFMCFGSGVTAGALALYPFDLIDAVEIAADVLDAAPLFSEVNDDVLHNPAVNFVVDDGRNFLMLARDAYDVITFEPMPLVLAGVSAFYTREYYEQCLERLARGGVVSQWVPLHSLAPELVRSLTRTFVEVFPHHCVWFINADLFLIGGRDPLHVSWDRVSARLGAPKIREALEDVGFSDAFEFLSCFFMGETAMTHWTGSGRIMTDDLPWAEFEAPKARYVRHTAPNLAALIGHYESPTVIVAFGDNVAAREAAERRHAAARAALEGLRAYHESALDQRAEEGFREALTIDLLHANGRYYLLNLVLGKADRALRWKEPEQALKILEENMTVFSNEPEVFRRLSAAYAALGRHEEAREALKRAVTIH